MPATSSPSPGWSSSPDASVALSDTFSPTLTSPLPLFVSLSLSVAFSGKMPLGENDKRALFWGFVSIFFALPTGIFVDALIRMARHTAPATKDLNYHQTLWRGTQLYSAAFMFTLLSTVAGSYSAFKAWWYDMDLSMWTSFRVKANEFEKVLPVPHFPLPLSHCLPLSFCRFGRNGGLSTHTSPSGGSHCTPTSRSAPSE
jgi:hypothetical protein